MAYVAPARMAVLTDVTAQDWISSHLQPNDNPMDHLFHHVYPDLNQDLTAEICCVMAGSYQHSRCLHAGYYHGDYPR